MEKENVPPACASAPAASRSGALTSMPNVLCIDDNVPFLYAFSALLELAGFAVTVSGVPAEGLALMEKGTFDLAILDYHMPGMNGAQLARRIRRSRPEMPLVLLSANDSVPAADLQAFDCYLAKGLNFREILLAVRSLLPARSGASEARSRKI